MSLDDALAEGHPRALRPRRDPLLREVVAWFAPREGRAGVEVGCGLVTRTAFTATAG